MEAGLIPGLLNDYCNEYYLEYDEKVYTIRAINLIYPVMVAVEEEKAKMKKKG